MNLFVFSPVLKEQACKAHVLFNKGRLRIVEHIDHSSYYIGMNLT